MATLHQRICGFKSHLMLPEYILQNGKAIQVSMICDKCGARTIWHEIPSGEHQPKEQS